jgi:hypothetical protein
MDHLKHPSRTYFTYQSRPHGIHTKHQAKPNKKTFFPEQFIILAVSFSLETAELSLDLIKAKSILESDKPDSHCTLQSSFYALNYVNNYIPVLTEFKFPLNQILHSQIFTWTEEANLAWERI